MRIRFPFAATFLLLLFLSAYLGLLPHSLAPTPPRFLNNKLIHLLLLFLLTLVFYWIVETTRRRSVHLTLAVCTGCFGLGPELVQAVLPNGRSFDPWDVVANVVGSLAALGLCSWYHRRMSERRRRHRRPFRDGGESGGIEREQVDVELGEGVSRREPGQGEEPQHRLLGDALASGVEVMHDAADPEAESETDLGNALPVQGLAEVAKAKD